MKQFLKDYLTDKTEDEKYYTFVYSEDNNKDALTDAWLENRTSYIYKVAVLAAIDNNKCDFVHIAIGVQRSENWNPEIKGYFHFSEGENDDMGRVMERALDLLKMTHPAFES